MIVITDDGVRNNFALVVEIDDESLNKLELDVSKARNQEFMQSLIESKGDNAHIISLNLMDERNIAKHMFELLKTYESVSWIRNNEFFIRRR